jgi:outer membrane protein OmpU
MTSIHGYSMNPGGMGIPVFLNTSTGFSSTSVLVDRYRTSGIGSSYTFGKLGVAAVYANTRLETLGHANTLQSMNANIHYFILPDMQVTGGYGYSRFTAYSWNEFNLAFDYLLSKRTDIITSADYQKATGGARADLVTLPISGDNKQLVLRIAMRHKF